MQIKGRNIILRDFMESDIESGNNRMIHVAEKIGFKECRRKKDLRKVRGQHYDGLTFKLDEEKFWAFFAINHFR